MITIDCELAASVSLSIELWYFLAVVVLCCLFAVVIYWLVRANRDLTKRVELMIEEDKKRGDCRVKVKSSQLELMYKVGILISHASDTSFIM